MSNVANPLERSNVPASQTFGKRVRFLNGEYTGQLKDGLRHGLGKETANDGSSYTGEWSNNQRHGFGTLVNALTNSFSGRFKAGQMHEGGVVKTASGDSYDVEYNEGLLLFSKKISGSGDKKLAGLRDKGTAKEGEAVKMIESGGTPPPIQMPFIPASKPVSTFKKPEVRRAITEEKFTDASTAVKKAQAAGTIEMFGDEEEEPAVRPSGGMSSQSIHRKDDEVQYADPSMLVHVPAIISDRMDWHWEELQSTEAAKFLTAYGKEGSFLVRTRPMNSQEHALAALLSGTVHHFKIEFVGDHVMLGGVKKKDDSTPACIFSEE